MDGLIPFVYNKIKGNMQRRKYKCLSAGAAQDYHIENFYLLGHQDPSYGNGTPNIIKMSSFQLEDSHHRRNKSMGDFPGRCASALGAEAKAVNGASPSRHRRIVSFRSSRMFSCVSGV